MKIWLKIHHQEEEVVLTACDEKLLGSKLGPDEEGVVVQLKEPFYGGTLVDIEEVIQFMDQATIINMFGECVTLLIEKGIISKIAVIFVAGVPHLQMCVF